jgi:hypothetical protein
VALHIIKPLLHKLTQEIRLEVVALEQTHTPHQVVQNGEAQRAADQTQVLSMRAEVQCMAAAAVVAEELTTVLEVLEELEVDIYILVAAAVQVEVATEIMDQTETMDQFLGVALAAVVVEQIAQARVALEAMAAFLAVVAAAAVEAAQAHLLEVMEPVEK